MKLEDYGLSREWHFVTPRRGSSATLADHLYAFFQCGRNSEDLNGKYNNLLIGVRFFRTNLSDEHVFIYHSPDYGEMISTKLTDYFRANFSKNYSLNYHSRLGCIELRKC